ncbi:Mitochondrial ATPase complex subunit atp10 [Puccinia graminis f. sp. tritici]|uniref:Mitochondrial ATPase complex subunit atp10 n=1 Tax=Puccinia graminis f. sp. tritici TaxID=56615 RepID=A0A5B0P1N1_PUCGR|nr:Mitochondrial ATPase complex subunit atp10 [Puccinia graminis f. sp. tritici]
MLSSPSRSTVRQLTTQQLLRRPPSTFSHRRSPRWYSSRPDPSRTDSNVDQAKPVNLPAATSSSPEASQAPSTTETERPKPPPYLPRPLGVEDPPSTRPPTEEEKLAKLVDEQARLQERKHLGPCIFQISVGSLFRTKRQNIPPISSQIKSQSWLSRVQGCPK